MSLSAKDPRPLEQCAICQIGPLTERGHDVRWFRRDPYRWQSVWSALLDEQATDGWMEMHVLMSVRVIEPKAGRCEGRELRLDLCAELPPRGQGEVISNPELGLIRRELAIRADQIGNEPSR